MKKFYIHSLPIVMAAMMMAACSNEDVAEPMGDKNAQETRTWQVSINAGPAGETKAISVGGNNWQTLYTNWDPNDAVEVVKAGVSVGTLHADVSAGNSAYATLKGTLTGTFNIGDAVTLYYHTAALDYTGQAGTPAGVSTNKSYLTATSTVKSVNGSGGFLSMSDAAFSPMQAYLELSFTKTGGIPLEITSLDIWADGGKLVKTKALDGTTTYATEAAPLTITPASATNKFFIALRDENGAANILHFKATTSDNTYIYEGSKDMKWGKYYTGTVTMSAGYRLLSTATAGDIGKVVCASGHLHDAKTAVPTGHTAVGILGKVSKTGHGRILALKNAMWQPWTTIDSWQQWDDPTLTNDPNLLNDINNYYFLLVNTLLKLLPLLYMKVQLLPEVDTDGAFVPKDQVTEDDYNYIRAGVYNLLHKHDEYEMLVWDEDMQTEESRWCSVSEGLADIYQALRNFVAVYQQRVEPCMLDALWQLREDFELYWGQTLLDTLRQLHRIRYSNNVDEEDSQQV